MHKSNSLESTINSETNSETHSKKWFSKISFIPKKLKSGKSTSTLSTALNNAKKNSTLDSVTQWENTIYDPSGENTYLSNGTLLTQTSQLTLNNSKNENTLDTDTSNIINISVESKQQNETTEDDTFKNVKLNLYNRQRRMTSSRLKLMEHRRSSSEHVNTHSQRPRSYSDVPAPIQPFQSNSLYSYNDEYIAESTEYDESRRNIPHLRIVKENYYLENDLDLCDVKTPVITTKNTPVDTSNITSSSNTIMENFSARNTTVASATPVMRPHKSAPTRDDKFSKFIEAMQNRTCDNMTAKEFALAVGITIRSDDYSDDEYDDDTNSMCTLSSTLSQLTANGRVPTANEIYNALSIKSSYRQRRKQSAPILSLEMFNPPTPGEFHRSSSCSHSLKNFPRVTGEISNQKLEKKNIPMVKSNESNLTCVASTSSIHSSHSGNTTSYISDLPDSDYDSFCSNCSIIQHSTNAPEFNGTNNITTTFYSLPRNDLNSNENKKKPIVASKSTNSIPVNNYYSYSTHRGEVGIVSSNNRRPSRVASSISANHSQSKSINSSPNLTTTNLLNTSSNASDNHMYINSKSIPINNNSSVTSNKYPTSYSWSNGLNDTPKPRLSSTLITVIKRTDKVKPVKVEVYTKGRFTVTHEIYNHNRSASCHVFQVERY